MGKAITQRQNADGTHTVEAAVHVLLYKDGRHVIAQGLEVDYCASGLTLEEAKQNFALGFTETLKVNCEEFGPVVAAQKLIRPAPAEFFHAYMAAAMDAAAKQQKAEHLELEHEDVRESVVPRLLEFLRGRSPMMCEAAAG